MLVFRPHLVQNCKMVVPEAYGKDRVLKLKAIEF